MYLSGEGEIEASDGTVRALRPGTILLVDDTTAKGHITRVTGTEETNVWLPAVEASGVPEDLRIHDLRHTAASLMISAGASVKAVQQTLGGHASAQITLDRYSHLYTDDLEALATRLNDRYRDAEQDAETARTRPSEDGIIRETGA